MLRPLDEANAIHKGGRISADAAADTLRHRQQPPPLIVAYGLDPHLCGFSEPPDGDRVEAGTRRDARWDELRGCFGHDLTPYLGTELKVWAGSGMAVEVDHE